MPGLKSPAIATEYLIPFNQLLAIHCKRGLVWGELEFVLPGEKVVRLHGTEWGETQRFTIILMLTGGGGVAR